MSGLTYSAPPSLVPFLTTDKFIALVCGPVGSTKTTAGIIKIAMMAKQMAACNDGIRRSRAIWVRRSRQMLFDTSVKDFLSWYPDGEAGVFQKTEAKFDLRFDDVHCEVLFRPMEDASDINRLLSLQGSFAIFDEFREISPDVFEAMQGRLGRYPDKKLVPPRPEWGVDTKGNPIGGCVDDFGRPMKRLWGMSNPPDFGTYFEELLQNPPNTVHVTIQPSGMSPEADWIKYLPENYYEDLAEGKSQDYIDVYIHNKFGKSLAGQPVFRCFDRTTHVAKESLRPLPTTLVIGVDCGLNPTAVLTQQTYDGRILVLDAITGTEGGMGALRFIREKLRPLVQNKYRNHAVVVCIDPAAFQRAQTDEKTVADIFRNEGFVTVPAVTNVITARLAAGESFMTRTVNGNQALMVDPGCKDLIKSLAGMYRYKINAKGETDDKPEKNHPWSDYCFVAGTMVNTPEGLKDIATLQPGDVVCTHDGIDVVAATGSREADTITLELTDGTVLTCTDDHPFAVNNHTCFLRADALTSEHVLVTTKGENGIDKTPSKRSVVAVKRVYRSGVQKVYNLTTDRTHMYYVHGVLVHNCDAFTYACLHHDRGASFGARVQRMSKRPVVPVSSAGWT